VAGSQAEVRHSQSEIAREQSSVALAEANYAAVHAAFTRLSEASKRRPGLIAEQELDDSRAKDLDAQAKINVAKSALEASKEQLGISQAENQRVQSLKDYSVVTAPFNGVITMRYADVGSLIQAGTASNTQSMPLVKVAQSDLLRLRMPVPEEDVLFLNIGGDVSIKLQANGKTFTGKIIRFTRELTTSTRTMLVEVDVPNPDLTLSAGMTAQTTIVLQAKKNVLTVPAGAVLKEDSQASVLIVDTYNKVQKVLVTLGIQSPDRIEITQGLSEQQSVIVSGQTNYQPGQIVHPQLSTISMPKQEDNQ
jgi:RND family efflux transporter MFP subunit